VPNSYQDLLQPRWRGQLGLEAADVAWFAAVPEVIAVQPEPAMLAVTFPVTMTCATRRSFACTPVGVVTETEVAPVAVPVCVFRWVTAGSMT